MMLESFPAQWMVTDPHCVDLGATNAVGSVRHLKVYWRVKSMLCLSLDEGIIDETNSCDEYQPQS